MPIDQAQAHIVGRHLAVEQPVPGLGNGDGFGQEIMHFDDFDAALAHLVHKIEMVTLGVLHPHHIVEQQIIAVGRRQAGMRQARRADHHLAQDADFGMNAVNGLITRRCWGSAHH